MYCMRKIRVNENDSLFRYCTDICTKARKLYNAANFLIRQNMTGLKKPHEKRQPSENEGIRRAMCGIERLNRLRQENFEGKLSRIRDDGTLSENEKSEKIGKLSRPTVAPFPSEKKWFLNYNTLDGILKTLGDPDYTALPSQTAQQVLRKLTGNWESYFKAVTAYKKSPSGFTGKPRIIKYKKKDSESNAVFTYQQCRIKENQNGKTYLKFPYTEHKLWVGKLTDGMRFVQAEIVPTHRIYEILLTFDVTTENESAAVGTGTGEVPVAETNHRRIAGMDLGVDNLAAITDNIGSRPVLIRGRALKSANRYANKKVAELKSILDNGVDEDGNRLTASQRKGIQRRIDRIWLKREDFISDYFHKAAKAVVTYLISSGIDTLVVGYNAGWKQDSSMGKVNNQNFIGIPFNRFISILKYLCERNGISFIKQEESYTSKASFLDMDDISVYGRENGKPVFSGNRIARGLYRSKNGTVINADVNGSLNIIRKCFPDAFAEAVDYGIYGYTETWGFRKFYKKVS